MMTGKLPFDDLSTSQLINKIVIGKIDYP